MRKTFRRSRVAWIAAVGLLACRSNEPSSDEAGGGDSSPTISASAAASDSAPEPEPTQWTLREVAKRLTDGGLVVTDSGRESVRHSFLGVEGRQMKVSGSALQVFIYAEPATRKADSDRVDTIRVAPKDMIIDWVTTPHLIASGNLIGIHLTPNERLAERVRLILEAWHAKN